MSRKLVVSVLVLLALILTACAQPAVPAPAEEAAAPAAEEASAPTADVAKESPMLAEMVAAGSLPPLEERLPAEPFVVGPGIIVAEDELTDWTPGQFGGTMNFAHGDSDWNPDIFIMMNEHLLMAPGIGIDPIRPNIVKDFKVEDDNKVFTFQLREGLKWSDGEPVTTEDVRFVYEDIYLNEQLTPSFPAKFRAGGRPDGEIMQLEIIDDYTFKLSFSEPYGSLLRELSIKGWQGYSDLLRPAHYLKQFHIDYTPMEELKPMLEELNLTDEWWQLFTNKTCENWHVTRLRCIGYPGLYPWLSIDSGQPGVLIFERNPYYFKVDTEGKQLPYVDKLISSLVQDTNMVNTKVMAGDIDFVREDSALVNLPMYKENEEIGNFRTILLNNHVDPTALWLNYTNEDPTWRLVTGDLRFRQALNMAINRQEIIDSIYYGLATPPSLVPGEYDVEKANQLLDEMGMDKRDADGMRLAPNGEPFELFIETADYAPDIIPVGELIVEHMKQVDIRTSLKVVDSTLMGQRMDANEHFATIIWSVQPMWPNGTWTDYLPTNQWGRLWQLWYNSGGTDGEEPPAPVKRLYEIQTGRVQGLPGSDEDQALTEEMYKIHYDNLYIFNIAENVNYALIVDADLGNVQTSGQAIGADNSGEQFFYKQ
jgi:peptide/nickel transport system substrate-binding protein